MHSYVKANLEPAKRAAAGDAEHLIQKRAETPAASDAGANTESQNLTSTARSLLQLREALDDGADVQSHLTLQRAFNKRTAKPLQRKPNATGLPDRLKAGVEQLSGLAMDDVRVHYNSPRPAAVQAHAYAQGTEIHLGPGQQQHLPHEAWHVVQQKQGRVKPTLQMKGVAVNDDSGLEREADRMGARANMSLEPHVAVRSIDHSIASPKDGGQSVPIQMKGWRWTAEKKWEALDTKEEGPEPPAEATAEAPDFGVNSIYDTSIYDIITRRFHQDEKSYYKYWEAKNKIKLESGPFKEPQGLAAVDTPAAAAGAGAVGKLKGFLTDGILTPGELKGRATTSGDEKVRNDQISVNAWPASTDAAEAKKIAEFAVHYRAGGALPVAIEQHGDKHTENIDADAARLAALSNRARESALAIIQPDKLTDQHQAAVKEKLTDGGSGETTLTGGIKAANFIKVLVPAQFKSFFPHAAQGRIIFVGDKKQQVAYNIIGKETRIVTIDVPDYQPALQAILEANPKSAFLTHVIRLGKPEALTENLAQSGAASAQSAANTVNADSKADSKSDSKSAVDPVKANVNQSAGALAANVAKPHFKMTVGPVKADLKASEAAAATAKVSADLLAALKQSERMMSKIMDDLLDHILPEAIDEPNRIRRALRLSYQGKDPASGETITIANPRAYP